MESQDMGEAVAVLSEVLLTDGQITPPLGNNGPDDGAVPVTYAAWDVPIVSEPARGRILDEDTRTNR